MSSSHHAEWRFRVELLSALADMLPLCKQAGKVEVRLHSMPDSLTHVRLMRAGLIGKLATLKGSIVRISSIRPKVSALEWCSWSSFPSFLVGGVGSCCWLLVFGFWLWF